MNRHIHFDEGKQVRKGEVLDELDKEEALADLATAEATERDSRSQFTPIPASVRRKISASSWSVVAAMVI